MPRTSTKAPTFKSESEEADWYAIPAGRRSAEREFVRAIKEGTLMVNSAGLKIPGTDPKVLEEIMKRAMANTTRAISLRIPVTDIARAKQIAASHGVGYQTVLKDAIRKGLKKAG
jgi:ABC-type branched-subunit amino acid transport system substrate-binding protein